MNFTATAPSGAGDANYPELFFLQILIHFRRLMEAYQSQVDENELDSLPIT